MADTPLDQISTDEKIAQAQEMLSIATRNYYVKAYADAVDDFSTVCSILAEVYGPTSEELGTPYLMYAKCLIAMGQDENKIMDIPEEENGDDEDDDDEEDDEAEAAANGEEAEAKPETNGTTEKEDEKEEASNGEEAKEEPSSSSAAAAPEVIDTAQPGSSTGITKGEMDTAEDEEDEDDVANLQVAWEVLELAVGIFSQIPSRAKELAESYIELAGISFENSNFEAAIKDFNQALKVLNTLPEKDNRELAELHYKIGLAYTMLNLFEEGKISLLKACDYLDYVIMTEEAKEQTETLAEVIKDLKETKAEIENKIAEVEDYKQQSMEEVKRELSKLVGHNDAFDAAAGEGSSSAKPAANISHLIKRKKPDEGASGTGTANGSGDTPANDITHLANLRTVNI